ncbi:MAG TPA: RDD family protein [Terriglobales bacterium]|nr:RDD family protein [Terriglobales bacterium]
MDCPKCGNRISTYSRKCGLCLATIPPAQYLLEESGVVERAAPVIAEERRFDRTAPRTARLGDRLIAAALDTVIVLAAISLICAWTFRKWGFTNADGLHLTAASLLAAGALGITFSFAYLWLFEASAGATLGKIIVGIRIARTAAHSCVAASAIRNALRLVDGIGFYLVGAVFAGCSRLRQRLGDILAGTIVVEAKFTPIAKAAAVVLWLSALSGAAWGLPRIWSATEQSSQPPRYLGSTVVQLGYTADSAYVSSYRLRVDFRRQSATPTDVTAVDSSLR